MAGRVFHECKSVVAHLSTVELLSVLRAKLAREEDLLDEIQRIQNTQKSEDAIPGSDNCALDGPQSTGQEQACESAPSEAENIKTTAMEGSSLGVSADRLLRWFSMSTASGFR